MAVLTGGTGGSGGGATTLSGLTDVSVAGAAQGDVFYYNGSAWVKLTAGTSGQFLKTQGAGANPTWDTVAGGGASALDDLSDVTASSPSQGDILYYNGSGWVKLAKGADGQFLKSTTGNPAWDSIGGGGDLLASNNLSDVNSAATARQNLDLEIGVDVQAYSAVLAATTASFTTADETKLDGIEALADVTDATNILAAGGVTTDATQTLTNKNYINTLNNRSGASYTAVSSDAGKVITMSNGSGNTFTIPANSSVAYAIGTTLTIVQLGAGQTTIAINTDTLNSNNGNKISGRYGTATALKVTSTSWVLMGDLTT